MPVYEYGLYHITFYVQQRIPTFSTFSNLSQPPASSRQAARSARICETRNGPGNFVSNHNLMFVIQM